VEVEAIVAVRVAVRVVVRAIVRVGVGDNESTLYTRRIIGYNPTTLGHSRPPLNTLGGLTAPRPRDMT
jgi:hypothetical protein